MTRGGSDLGFHTWNGAGFDHWPGNTTTTYDANEWRSSKPAAGGGDRGATASGIFDLDIITSGAIGIRMVSAHESQTTAISSTGVLSVEQIG